MLVLYLENTRKGVIPNAQKIFFIIFIVSMAINLCMGFCLIFGFDNEIDYAQIILMKRVPNQSGTENGEEND
jgi:hypothetical protein